MNLNEIINLSIAERILFMEKIWNSIEQDKIELSDVHKKELDSRLERFKRGETKFYTWEEIKKDLHPSK